ncbi:LysR family transcriptional regulator [Brenneria izadpanahii]|uniref:LysR family transcriptional regulator n=1 Tax=Brenneria izadpanahii TaxID=2722756 RepID=A0ABX7UTG0_9GAMM|nr:LysR family transcriptional regulator [Brenneria izadpanahii]QTF07872.1 LysR family transcriptional regulator [Brenneria izadpanahii]
MKTPPTDALWMHLYLLTVLAEQQSFTRAAERLEISKAAMSQKIKQLEEQIGVALVQRTTRSVRLTSAGEQLVADLQQPFAQISQSFLAVRDASGPVRGLVRVTAPVAFARQQLVPRISEYLRAYPQVRVQLEVSDRMVSLVSEGFDLAIRHSNLLPETHVAQQLCATRTLLVASPDYLDSHGTPDHPLTLADHDCLYYPRGTDLPRWRFMHCARAGETLAVDVKGPFATNNSESVRDAALSGLGIAMLPDFSARTAIESGALREVLPDWRIVDAFADNIWIIRPYAAHVPRAVISFSHWLRSQFVH